MANKLTVKKGDNVWQKINMTYNLIALIDSYNEDFAIPNGKPLIPRTAVNGSDATSIV